MNNCPKCGNPLQIGTESCPICGTNILASLNQEENKNVETISNSISNPQPNNIVTVSSVATPINETANIYGKNEVTEEAPLEKNIQSVSNLEHSQEPTHKVTTDSEIAIPVKEESSSTFVTQPSTPNVDAMQISTQNNEPVIPLPQENDANQNQVSIDPNSIAPTVEKIEISSPVPSIPASLNQETTTVNVDLEPQQVKEEVKPVKKKFNKNILLLGVLAIVIVVGAIYVMSNPTSTVAPPPATNNQENKVVATSVSSNGYKFKIEEGWLSREDGYNVIITNTNDTVVIKLEHLNENLGNLSTAIIEKYFENRTEFSQTSINEMQISAKDTYLVNTNINQSPVQIYFISGGANLTLGATIVYQSEESKTKYEAKVTEMIGTLSYADDSYKAIDSIEMYSNVFGVYEDVFNSAYSEQPDYNGQPIIPGNNESGNNGEIIE